MDKLIFLCEEGGEILLIGMGVVFAFLVVMVLSMYIMAKVIVVLNKFFPEVVEEKKISQKDCKDDEVACAITVAMNKMLGGLNG